MSKDNQNPEQDLAPITERIDALQARLGASLSVDMTPDAFLYVLKADLDAANAAVDREAEMKRILKFVERYRTQNFSDNTRVSVPLYTGMLSPQAQTAWKTYTTRFVNPVYDGGRHRETYSDSAMVNVGRKGPDGQDGKFQTLKGKVEVEKIPELLTKISKSFHEILGLELPEDLKDPKTVEVEKAASNVEEPAQQEQPTSTGWADNLASDEFLYGKKLDPLDDFRIN